MIIFFSLILSTFKKPIDLLQTDALNKFKHQHPWGRCEIHFKFNNKCSLAFIIALAKAKKIEWEAN
jgi:hypothetical protein